MSAWMFLWILGRYEICFCIFCHLLADKRYFSESICAYGFYKNYTRHIKKVVAGVLNTLLYDSGFAVTLFWGFLSAKIGLYYFFIFAKVRAFAL